MKIKIENSSKKTSLLCGFVLENTNKVLGLPKFDTKTIVVINQSLKDMEGKLGKMNIVPLSEKKPIQRILLAGIGKKENLTNDTIRFVSGKIAQKARELKLKEFSPLIYKPLPFPFKTFNQRTSLRLPYSCGIIYGTYISSAVDL